MGVEVIVLMNRVDMQFVDLKSQYARLETQIRTAIDGVLEHGQFIMGPEVASFEQDLQQFADVPYAIGVSSGTDALKMVLMAKGVGPGDAVIVPAFTFVATAEVVKLLGATPIFCDVQADSFNIDVDVLQQLIAKVNSQTDLKLKGIVPVDLFGLPANYEAILKLAKQYDLFVLGDAAQSFGGALHENRVGSLCDVTATSFFPAKPLGCYGDGGAVFTHDEQLYKVIKSIQFHGKGDNQYDNVRIGMTGRLDTIQAAILRCKITILGDEIAKRQQVAQRYTEGLSQVVKTPKQYAGYQSAWAQYTIRSEKREQIKAHLQSKGIPSAIYYPCPLNEQPAYRCETRDLMPTEVAKRLSAEVLSLPMHPYLSHQQQDQIIAAVIEAVE